MFLSSWSLQKSKDHGKATLENSLAFSCKVIHSPTIPLPSIYPREMKTYVHPKTCVWLLIVTLFVVTPKMETTLCPSTDEWLDKIWYSYTMEYYTPIKNKERLIHATKWIMFSGNTLYFHLCDILAKVKFRDKEQFSCCQEQRVKEGVDYKGAQANFRGC